MGVNGTGQIFKGFTFDGQNSKNYGVHITGEAVYNAPVRDVEMITIPGRNGAFALDHGRFDNIEVTYPAGMFGATQTDFADGISALRNFLCSRKGYCRLTDDYNSDEYRMAVYKNGLEASPVQYGQAGEFDITFNCKPQRFLTSGETAVTKANNSTITNPTLFPASPLLQVTGYGTINLGNESLTVNQKYLGDIVVKNNGLYFDQTTKTITIDTTYANSGNAIKLNAQFNANFDGTRFISSISTNHTGNGYTSSNFQTTIAFLQMYTGDISFVYGTSRTETNSATISITNDQGTTVTGSMSFSVAYNGSNSFTFTCSASMNSPYTLEQTSMTHSQIILNSTKTINPIYIDLEIGEAYAYNNGVMTSANNTVVLPPELPTLKPGNTTITFPNTITQLKITPRWWKV